jgi:general secretion pathway protein I
MPAEHGLGVCGRSAENGFMLIEIMVALTVFALAAMALLRLESATIRGASILDQTLLAQMVARSVAIEAVTEAQAPAPGVTTGAEENGGVLWSWTRAVAATGNREVVRIGVAVADPSGRVLSRLEMVRPPTRAASVSVQ